MSGRRGRPPLACQVFTIHITLNLREGEDDDLLRFFTNLPPHRRAAALKAALRAGGMAVQAENAAADDELSEAAADLLFG
jgi:hypothetical protein